MKNAISGALSGALCLFSSACLAGYQSCGNQVVGDNVSTCPDGSIPSYHASQISAPAPQPRQAQAVQPYRSQPAPHLFTRQEREEMLRNDDKAGRTHNSMSKGAGARPNAGYSDPYNSGGWNYDRNQPASPIWNPN